MGHRMLDAYRGTLETIIKSLPDGPKRDAILLFLSGCATVIRGEHAKIDKLLGYPRPIVDTAG
jgi:hypothetical protein